VRRIGAGSVVAAIVALVSGATVLAAQGAQRVARPAQPSAERSAEARLVPARGVVRALAGTWRFEMRFAGNFDAPADVAGMRVFKPLFDSLRLEWTEVLEHSPVQGQGVLGFDEKSGRFFSSGVYSAGTAPEFMTGTLDDGEPLVIFTPLPFAPDAGRVPGQAFALNVIDADHFTVAALDHAWRAVFTRQPSSAPVP